jgi:outer membrane protein
MKRIGEIMSKKKRRKVFIIEYAALLIGWAAIMGADANIAYKNKVLSLEECIALAQQNNPGLASQSYDVDAAKARIDEKKGDRLPFISGKGNYSRFSKNVLPGSDDQDYRFSVQVSQPLFQGGGLSASVANARSNWKAAQYRYESRLQDLILEVKDAYFNYLKNKRLLEVAQHALKQAKTYREAAQERFRLGVARLADTIKAEVEVSDAELKMIEAQNALLTAGGRLNKVMGLPVTRPIRVKDLLEQRDITYNRFEVENLIREAEKQLPELQEIDMIIRAQQAAVKIAKSEYWPTFSFGASYSWNGSSISVLEREWDIGLSLDIPIFKGLSRKARVSQQRARLQLLNQEKEELRQNVSLAVWVDYLKVKETKERITNSQKHLKNAKENLSIAEGEYKEGVSSMLELIDAQTIYVNAERYYINVLTEYRLAWAKLERSIGVIK